MDEGGREGRVGSCKHMLHGAMLGDGNKVLAKTTEPESLSWCF